jgi:hypothetical protein
VEGFFTRPLTKLERTALDAEVVRYGKFMGLPARLEVKAAP